MKRGCNSRLSTVAVDQGRAAEFRENHTMTRKKKDSSISCAAPNAGSSHAPANRASRSTVPAAWPTGISQMGLTIKASQNSDAVEISRDGLVAAAKSVAAPTEAGADDPAPKDTTENKDD